MNVITEKFKDTSAALFNDLETRFNEAPLIRKSLDETPLWSKSIEVAYLDDSFIVHSNGQRLGDMGELQRFQAHSGVVSDALGVQLAVTNLDTPEEDAYLESPTPGILNGIREGIPEEVEVNKGALVAVEAGGIDPDEHGKFLSRGQMPIALKPGALLHDIGTHMLPFISLNKDVFAALVAVAKRGEQNPAYYEIAADLFEKLTVDISAGGYITPKTMRELTRYTSTPLLNPFVARKLAKKQTQTMAALRAWAVQT